MRGCVLTDCKDVMLVSELARRAVDGLVWGELKLRYPADTRLSAAAQAQFQRSSLALEPLASCVSVHYVFEGAPYSVRLLFACDADHQALAPRSLAMDVSTGARSALFRDAVLHALSLLGPARIRSGSQSQPFDEPAPSVLQALQLGYVWPSELDHWVAGWQDGRLGVGQSFESYLGATPAQVARIALLADPEDRDSELERVLAGRRACPRFLEEFHMEQAQG